MATQVPAVPVQEPFPIFTLAHKYLIYDANVIAHIRQAYNISGVLIGSLPQAPQQNVFLGVPLELMPEEARLLVEKEVGYIVDDVKAHKQGFLNGGLSPEERSAYQGALRKQGISAANEASKRTEERKKTALKQKAQPESGDWNDIPEDMLRPPTGPRKKSGMADDHAPMDEAKKQETEDDPDDSLFSTQSTSIKTSVSETVPFSLTPTTSQPLLKYAKESQSPPNVSASYDLYKYMHDRDYFLAPGLRFGCQYMAYPGDPLRFHSHFLCNGMDWDQQFDLLDIVGGGRLGTGVKKGFLIGGKEVTSAASGGQNVRPFCIEWAGM